MAASPITLDVTRAQVETMRAGMATKYAFYASSVPGEIGTFDLGHGYTLTATYAGHTLTLDVSDGIFRKYALEQVAEHAEEFLAV